MVDCFIARFVEKIYKGGHYLFNYYLFFLYLEQFGDLQRDFLAVGVFSYLFQNQQIIWYI